MNKLQSFIYLFICLTFYGKIALDSHAQQTNTIDLETISTCAAGAKFKITADLEGSLKSILQGDGAQGITEISTVVEWLKLFRKKDRIEAAKLYHKCVKDLLGSRNSYEDKIIFRCLVPKDTQVNIDKFTINKVSRQKEFSQLQNQFSEIFRRSLEIIHGEIYLDKDMNFYRKSLEGKYVIGRKQTDTESQQELTKFDQSGLELNFLNFISYFEQRLIGFEKNPNIDFAYLKMATYLTHEGKLEVFGLFEVLDQKNNAIQMGMKMILARCGRV